MRYLVRFSYVSLAYLLVGCLTLASPADAARQHRLPGVSDHREEGQTPRRSTLDMTRFTPYGTHARTTRPYYGPNRGRPGWRHRSPQRDSEPPRKAKPPHDLRATLNKNLARRASPDGDRPLKRIRKEKEEAAKQAPDPRTILRQTLIEHSHYTQTIKYCDLCANRFGEFYCLSLKPLQNKPCIECKFEPSASKKVRDKRHRRFTAMYATKRLEQLDTPGPNEAKIMRAYFMNSPPLQAYFLANNLIPAEDSPPLYVNLDLLIRNPRMKEVIEQIPPLPDFVNQETLHRRIQALYDKKRIITVKTDDGSNRETTEPYFGITPSAIYLKAPSILAERIFGLKNSSAAISQRCLRIVEEIEKYAEDPKIENRQYAKELMSCLNNGETACVDNAATQIGYAEEIMMNHHCPKHVLIIAMNALKKWIISEITNEVKEKPVPRTSGNKAVNVRTETTEAYLSNLRRTQGTLCMLPIMPQLRFEGGGYSKRQTQPFSALMESFMTVATNPETLVQFMVGQSRVPEEFRRSAYHAALNEEHDLVGTATELYESALSEEAPGSLAHTSPQTIIDPALAGLMAPHAIRDLLESGFLTSDPCYASRIIPATRY